MYAHTCRYRQCAHRAQLILPDHATIRYGKRHYMHADCYVRSGKPLADLTHTELGMLPYRVLQELGKLEEVERLHAEKEPTHVEPEAQAPTEAPTQATPRVFKVCPECGDDDIVRNAWAVWNAITGEWELDELHDEIWCKDCEEFITPVDSDKPGTFSPKCAKCGEEFDPVEDEDICEDCDEKINAAVSRKRDQI